jgi:glutamate dehydrogenase/leucine dehydrogenase
VEKTFRQRRHKSTPNVTEEEIASLSAEMTQKCILAGLPFGVLKRHSPYRHESVGTRHVRIWKRTFQIGFSSLQWCAAPDVNTNSVAIDASCGMRIGKRLAQARISATGKSTAFP